MRSLIVIYSPYFQTPSFDYTYILTFNEYIFNLKLILFFLHLTPYKTKKTFIINENEYFDDLLDTDLYKIAKILNPPNTEILTIKNQKRNC